MSRGPYLCLASVAEKQAVPPEWEYVMRRERQEILPRVFLGPYAAAGKSKLEELQREGITHVVCARGEVEARLVRPHHPTHLSYLTVQLGDSVTEQLLPKLPEVKAFIDGCLAGGGKVLVHCADGMSRAPSLLIAYIMETFNTDFKTALSFVQQRRFCVQPNDGFEQQLKEFEPIYRARRETVAREGAGLGKRRREEPADEGMECDGVGQ